MNNCKYCKADCAMRGEENLKECNGHIPMSNADRIRSMSDEELAELIVVRIKDIHHQGMRELAYSAWMEWLKKPAEQKSYNKIIKSC